MLEKIVKALPDCHVEASVTTEMSDNLNFENNKFESAESGETTKLEVRVTKGMQSAYAWTNNLNNWEELAVRAKKLMNASSKLKIEPVISKIPSLNKSFTHPLIKKADIELLKSKGEVLINTVKGLKSNVSQLVITKSLAKKTFLNSNQVSSVQDQSAIITELECACGNISVWDVRTSQGLDLDFEKIGRLNGQLCKDSLNPKTISAQKRDVVFDFSAINGLIQLLIPSLFANNVIEHKSFFEDKLGEKVANPSLTIKDVGSLPNGVNNQVMDSEGVATTDKALISKGVLKSFLNDLYTASRIGAKPSGNSAGLLKRGFISSNNVVIESGNTTKSDLLKDCIYVNNVMGMHTANIVSGDFALNALNAFDYKDGKKPLRDVMISGNIFELLKKVVAIGKESRQDGGLKTPMIRCRDIQVVG